MKSRQDNKNQFMLKEYELISTRISTIYLAGPTTMALGLTVVGSILVYGYENQIKEALFFLPVASFFPLLIALAMYTEEKCLAAYKKFLEEKINDLVGEKIVLWESEIAGKRHKDLAKFTLYIIYVSFLLLCIYIGLLEAWQKASQLLFFFLLALSAVLAILSIVAAIRFESSFQAVYSQCKKVEIGATRKSPQARKISKNSVENV